MLSPTAGFDLIVTRRHVFQAFLGDKAVATTVLRFMGAEEVARFLKQAGLREVSWYGDWTRSPLTHDSSEIHTLEGVQLNRAGRELAADSGCDIFPHPAVHFSRAAEYRNDM